MVKLYHTTRNQKGKNIYNYSHYVKIGLQQIDQDSRTHHETKTRLLEEIFTILNPGIGIFQSRNPGTGKEVRDCNL